MIQTHDLCNTGATGHYQFVCPSKILRTKHCFQFLLGLTMVPREMKTMLVQNLEAGTNKGYYGIFDSGLLMLLRHTVKGVGYNN